MQVFLKRVYIIFFSLILLSSSACFLSKKTVSGTFGKEKSKMSYIYLFDEANKNRLNGDLQKAEQQYLAALELNPQSAASYFYLASIYIARKDYQTALNFSKKAVKINPENYWYLLEKADLLKINGLENEAEIIYQKLLDKNPKNESVYDKLSEIYRKNNDIKKLIALYELKSDKYDDSPETKITLFNLYLKNKDFKKAEELIKNARKKYPENIFIAGAAAEFHYSTGNSNEAEKIYEKLLSEYPNNTDVNLSYALFCRKTGKQEQYFETVKNLMTSDLDFIKKTNLIISGRYPNFPDKEYKELLEILYENNQDEILANTMFAEYYLGKNDEKNAISYIIKAFELNPSDFNLAEMMFGILYDLKDFKKLEQLTKKYADYFPNKPKLFLYKGIAEYENKKYKQSEKTLQYGKSLIIENPELENQFNFYLSFIYKQKKEYDKAIEYINKIKNDKNLKIYEPFGDLLFLKGEKQKALEFWKKAKDFKQGGKNLDYKIKNFDNLTADDVF